MTGSSVDVDNDKMPIDDVSATQTKYITPKELVANTTSFLQAGSGAIPRTVQAKTREVVSVTDFGATGDGSTDDTALIQSGDTAVAARGRKGVLWFPATSVGYRTTDSLTQSNGVTWEGEDWGWTNLAGSAINAGVVIIKEHNNDCIKIGVASQVIGNRLRNIGIRSDKTTYTTGDGVKIGKGVDVRLERVNVFTVGGDSFVIGDNSVDAFHCQINDCYSNNPGARSFYVQSKWFKGSRMISDGGTIACELNTGAQHFSLSEFHFEGWTTNAIKCSGGRGRTSGHNVIQDTVGGALTAVSMVNTSGAQLVTWKGIDVLAASYNASSKAFSIAGSSNTQVKIVDCTIEGWGRAADVNGDNCTMRDNVISGCGKAFRMNASSFKFLENQTVSTVDTEVGEFVAGSNGRFLYNDLDKQLHTSGTILNTTNHARGNKGWVTRNQGQTAGITTGTAISHGLVDTPATGGVHPISYTSGVTDEVQLSAIGATTFTLAWAGTVTVQWGWSANCVCDP